MTPHDVAEAHARQLDSIRDRARAAGLEAHLPWIESIVRPAIGLATRPVRPEDLAVGATRIGGEPDVPSSFVWPEGSAEPVQFVAQVRLADIAPLDPRGLLPRTGTLSVFAEPPGDPAFVFVFPESEPLVRRPRPPEVLAILQEGSRVIGFRASGVDLFAELHLPTHTDAPAPLPRELADAFWYEVADAHMSALHPPWEPGAGAVHQMLGYASPKLDEHIQRADEEIVFGMASDDLAGMEWASAGMVWLYADRAALAGGEVRGLRAGF